MLLNERLAGLVAWLHDQLHGWAAGLSAAEQEAAGQPDAWAARDLLVHFAAWAEVLREKVVAAVEGRELPALPPDDEINRQFFDRNRGLSWAETLDKVDRAHVALEAQLRAMPAESLAAVLPSTERPASWIVLFEAVDHVLRHMAEHLLAQGRRDDAYALMADGAAHLTAVDETPRFRGVITYNQGCFYALSGSPTRALDALREALVDRPDLAEYAGQDPDFASLHDDPAFRALIGG